MSIKKKKKRVGRSQQRTDKLRTYESLVEVTCERRVGKEYVTKSSASSVALTDGQTAGLAQLGPGTPSY